MKTHHRHQSRYENIKVLYSARIYQTRFSRRWVNTPFRKIVYCIDEFWDPKSGINFQITSGTQHPSTCSSHFWKPTWFMRPTINDLFIFSVPQRLWANLWFRRFINSHDFISLHLQATDESGAVPSDTSVQHDKSASAILTSLAAAKEQEQDALAVSSGHIRFRFSLVCVFLFRVCKERAYCYT